MFKDAPAGGKLQLVRSIQPFCHRWLIGIVFRDNKNDLSPSLCTIPPVSVVMWRGQAGFIGIIYQTLTKIEIQ